MPLVLYIKGTGNLICEMGAKLKYDDSSSKQRSLGLSYQCY